MRSPPVDLCKYARGKIFDLLIRDRQPPKTMLQSAESHLPFVGEGEIQVNLHVCPSHGGATRYETPLDEELGSKHDRIMVVRGGGLSLSRGLASPQCPWNCLLDWPSRAKGSPAPGACLTLCRSLRSLPLHLDSAYRVSQRISPWARPLRAGLHCSWYRCVSRPGCRIQHIG